MPERRGFWDQLRRWRGIILLATVSIATLWFGATGRLVFYVHPRYLVFTIIMAGVALAFCTARVVMVVRARPAADHDHDEEDDDPAPRPGIQRVLSIGTIVIATAVAAAMVALPPATLSSATALQRDITNSSVAAGAASLTAAQTANNSAFANYSLLDWSSLLRQTSDPSFYAGKPVDVTGFVTPDPTDSANVFYVTRFVITCCAVDAQPVGIPVYVENWKGSYPANSWVKITGGLVADPSTKSSAELAVIPTGVKRVAQPADPYLY
ncbi:MAG TPA: TIGR03943 family protein [Galbitalea sp.]